MIPGFYHLPYPDAYHRRHVEDSLRRSRSLFKADGTARVASIIIERCWEGGFYGRRTSNFGGRVARLCDSHGYRA